MRRVVVCTVGAEGERANSNGRVGAAFSIGLNCSTELLDADRS